MAIDIKIETTWLDFILKWAKVIGLFGAIFLGFGKGYSLVKSQMALNEKNAAIAQETAAKVTRIEHYLSMNDKNYWLIMTQLADPRELSLQTAPTPGTKSITISVPDVSK